jgi:Peptidase A4 family
MSVKLGLVRPAAVLSTCVAAIAMHATTADAATRAHGDVIHVVGPRANANQSSNWYGYNQGTLEQGGKQFHSIAGNWTVPTATQHTRGQAEFSSTWIGIGGGCVDAKCRVGDTTLIQTGTEQDVSKSGAASYSAWWEVIPAPSLTIGKMTVRPGDRMHAAIAELVPGSEVWRITLQDLTRGQTFTTTVPYSSTHLTAEWIQETPLVFGTGGAGLAALPNLTNPAFDLAKTNGAAAHLKASEEIQLVNSSGRVIGAPSAPDAQADGFALCTWASSC